MPSVNVRVIDYNKYPYGSIFSKMVTVINYTLVPTAYIVLTQVS